MIYTSNSMFNHYSTLFKEKTINFKISHQSESEKSIVTYTY